MSPSDSSLTMTEKDQAAVQAVFEEGMTLKQELAAVQRLQPKKKEELRKKAKRYEKLLKEHKSIISRMFGE
jgi:hypothetical protein